MENRIFRYVFAAFFGLYFAAGFFGGSAAAAVATRTLRKDVSPGLATAIVVGCAVILIAALPLPKLVIRLFDRSVTFRGYSLLFWQTLMIVAAAFGVVFGCLLPNGPLNAT